MPSPSPSLKAAATWGRAATRSDAPWRRRALEQPQCDAGVDDDGVGFPASFDIARGGPQRDLGTVHDVASEADQVEPLGDRVGQADAGAHRESPNPHLRLADLRD